MEGIHTDREGGGRRMSGGEIRALAAGLALLASGLVVPSQATAQDLADFDYENLSFRGIGVIGSFIFPSTVESTEAIGVRVDMGYLGPGVRIVPTLSYWSSRLERDEVRALEESLERLVPSATVDLGTIDRSDLVLGLDAHVVWRVRYGFLTYMGSGAAVHFLNGGGEAVDGTFVEDLLDSVSAGFNLHGGIEYPLGPRVRALAEGRVEVLGDLYYPELRFGLQFMTSPPADDEELR